jgi:hypothetical protein
MPVLLLSLPLVTLLLLLRARLAVCRLLLHVLTLLRGLALLLLRWLLPSNRAAAAGPLAASLALRQWLRLSL